MLDPRWTVLACLAASAACAWAQTGEPGRGAGARAFTFSSNASVTETVTDNALLKGSEKRSDAITLLSAGVSVARRTDQFQGSLDYQLAGSVHARETRANSTTQSLRAVSNAELIDNFLFLDASAGISQNVLSPFGVQSVDATADTSNRTEARNLLVAPSLRGLIGSSLSYDARFEHARQSTDTPSGLGDSRTNAGTVTVGSVAGVQTGWSLQASRQRVSYDAGRSTTTSRLAGTLNHRYSPDLMLRASAGRERSDVTTATDANSTTWGVGLLWTPSQRTRVDLQRDHRYFGDAHSVNIEYRTPRSNWRFTSLRDVSTSSPSIVNAGAVTLFDLLYANAAQQIADPTARREAVLEQLRLAGRSPTETVGIGLLSSSVTLSNRQELSFGLQGVRTNASFSAFRSENRRIDARARPDDGLGAAGRVRQQGYSLALGHRLTPRSSVSLTLSQHETREELGQPGNELRSINLHWSSQLQSRGHVSLGARHVEFDSTQSPYTENAIFATLGIRF